MLASDFTTLLEVDMAAITLLRKCFCIDTPLVFNSGIVCDNGTDKSERIANKVAAVGGTIYLSGNGAKKYMDLSAFETKRIDVVYQQFEYPEYSQYSTSVFFRICLRWICCLIVEYSNRKRFFGAMLKE